jgi:hypothetical protein
MTYIGNIPYVANLIAQVLEIAAKHVERDIRARVTEVRFSVNGGATYVHADERGIHRHEGFLLTGE